MVWVGPRWAGSDPDGLGRTQMGWVGTRWAGSDPDGLGRTLMGWVGPRWAGSDPDEEIMAVAISPDQSTIASASTDTTIRTWKVISV
ncbi:MAG: hypothetical protein WDW36_000625 [Sanguina aurantia]